MLFLPLLSLLIISCQHTKQEVTGCSYSKEYGCKKCSKQVCEKCKNAKDGKLCKKCLAKSCDKCKKKSFCKYRKSKNAVSLIFPVNNSKVKGWVQFTNTEGKKVLIKAEVSGLKPDQKHGFHIHQYGDCRDNGQNVGNHFNPYEVKHGAPHQKEKHLGDLGNLKSNKKGIAFYQETMKMRVKKLIGRSIVVHADTDDLKSQPSGNSGAYIGCGVIGRLPSTEKTKKVDSKTTPPVKTVSDKKKEVKKVDSKTTPPVKTVSDKKKEVKKVDSKTTPPVKTVSDKKKEVTKKTEDSKKLGKETKKEEVKKVDSKTTPPVKTVSDKKEATKKQENKEEEKKATKKTENNKDTSSEKTSPDKKENNLKTAPPVTVVKGKAENQQKEKKK